MSVKIQFFNKSETMNSETVNIYGQDEDEPIISIQDENGLDTYNQAIISWSKDKSKLSHRRIFSLDSNSGQDIINRVISGKAHDILKLLEDYGTEFERKNQLQIKIIGLSNNKLNSIAVGKGRFVKNTLKDINLVGNVKQRMTRENFLKAYQLFGTIKRIPYINYEMNDVEAKCFYNIISQYKKLGKKEKEKYNRDHVSIQEIIEFCEKHKQKCILLNIAGNIIYSNEFERNSNYPNFIAILSNNHIYPLKNNAKSVHPELIKDDFILQDNTFNFMKMKQENITINKNGTVFYPDGVIKKETAEICTNFFKGMFLNFSHEKDMLKIRSLSWVSKNVQELKYEYDMPKCYFNMVYKLIDEREEFPVFTFDSLWQKYKKEGVNKMHYYLLKETAMNNLKEYGILSNFQDGHMIDYLINEKMISDDSIEYVKYYSYKYQFEKIRERLFGLIEHVLEKKHNVDIEPDNIEEQMDKYGIKKDFVIYNGIMGIDEDIRSEKIKYLPKEELDLLNFNNNYKNDTENKIVDWEIYEEDEKHGCKFIKSKSTKNYLNRINIYNFIVSQANIYLLKTLKETKLKNPNAKLLKIQVDALGFDIPIKSNLISKSFELNKKEPYKNYREFRQVYINGKEIIDDIIKFEFKNNITYQGAPGTGKTYTVKNNHKYDVSSTITNVCALNIKSNDIPSDTLYSLFKIYCPEKIFKACSKLRNKTLWIDEFSMIPRYIWNIIYIASRVYNVRLIISGDINQIPPVGENKINIDNQIIKNLFGKVEILKDEQRNDEFIVKLRDSILNDDQLKTYKLFKNNDSKKDWRKIDRHLVFTHKMAEYVNMEIMKDRGFKFKWSLNKLGEVKYEISEGVILGCRITKKACGIYKNDVWKVINIYDDKFELLNLRENQIKIFTHNQMDYFKVAFAMTTHSAQGLTIDDDMAVHECKFMIAIDTSILYTAITRARSINKLNTYYDQTIKKLDKKDYIIYRVISSDIDEDFDKFDKVKANKLKF